MSRQLASVTGSATSDTGSHTPTAVRGVGKQPRSLHSLRRATIYCQINNVLRGGIENRPGGQQPVQNTRLHNNLKQFRKVGFEEAKAWIPKADAAELARYWLSSLEHNKLSGLDPRIAEIEAINLAKQYTWWHVQRVGDMEQTQPDRVFQIMGGQLNSASSSEVQSRKTGNIIWLINDWEIQGECLLKVGIDWSTYGPSANLASWFCLEVQDVCSHTAHNRYEQGVAHHQPRGMTTFVCKEMARYVKQKGNNFRGLGRWCSMLLYAEKTIDFELFLPTVSDGRLHRETALSSSNNCGTSKTTGWPPRLASCL
jgi:hypothetical protein